MRKRKKGGCSAQTQGGATLRHALHGHSNKVLAVAVSQFATQAVSASDDHTARVWDIRKGTCRKKVSGHTDSISCLALSASGAVCLSGSRDGLVRLWDVASGNCTAILESESGHVASVAISADGATGVSGHTRGMLCHWDLKGKKRLSATRVNGESILGSSLAGNGSQAVLAGADGRIRIWDVNAERCIKILTGHKAAVTCVATAGQIDYIISGSEDQTVRVWEGEPKSCSVEFEGHTGAVNSVALSSNGHLAISGAEDSTLRVWNIKSKSDVAVLTGHDGPVYAVATSGDGSVTVSGGADGSIRVWDLGALASVKSSTAPLYLSAKIVLVGDSGVGKSGLGWRLATGRFRKTTSTHGQSFWMMDNLKHTRADRTECEAILWDLAGQQNYRLTHALFIDDADLALMLLNSVDDQDPLKGVEYWLCKLTKIEAVAGRRCRIILVAPRCDVSKPRLSESQLAEFCKQFSIQPIICRTSALKGTGVSDLLNRVRESLPWSDMVPTVTTDSFRRIKEYVLQLKSWHKQTNILVDWSELRASLRQTDFNWHFTDSEMTTAVGHLEKHGYVRILWPTGATERVLLFPEVLNNLAASFVLQAAANEKGLGALDEERIRNNEYDFSDVRGLVSTEREILLDEAGVVFISRNLAFRAKIGESTYLIFPELINERKPALMDEDVEEGPSYEIAGDIEHVYAAQVVLLGYTNVLTRIRQYRDRAEYETDDNQVCGFRKSTESEGLIELVLFFQANMTDANRQTFQGLFERFLRRRDSIDVIRYDRIRCTKCNYLQDQGEVIKRTKGGKGFICCSECGDNMALPKVGQPLITVTRAAEQVDQGEKAADVRTRFETSLRSLSNMLHRGGQRMPTCFISYAWGVPEHEKWVEKQLAADLQKAEIDVILDRWHNCSIGSDVARFIERITKADSVIAVGTPAYLRKYLNKVSATGSILAAEVNLINQRLTGTETSKETVRPILLSGETTKSLPPLMRGRSYADFRTSHNYFCAAFDLILSIHSIKFDDPSVIELRDSLRDHIHPSKAKRRIDQSPPTR